MKLGGRLSWACHTARVARYCATIYGFMAHPASHLACAAKIGARRGGGGFAQAQFAALPETHPPTRARGANLQKQAGARLPHASVLV